MAQGFETQGVNIPLLDPEEIVLLEDGRSQLETLNTQADRSTTSPQPSQTGKRSHHPKSQKRQLQQNMADRAECKRPLRPAKDILSRLRHDPSLTEEHFVIGYHDRHEPEIQEIDVAAWKGGGDVTDDEWIPQHRIAYFRRKDEGSQSRVWDRERRLDRVFGSGSVQSPEETRSEEDVEGREIDVEVES